MQGKAGMKPIANGLADGKSYEETYLRKRR